MYLASLVTSCVEQRITFNVKLSGQFSSFGSRLPSMTTRGEYGSKLKHLARTEYAESTVVAQLTGGENMPYSRTYWRDNKAAPFATLLQTIETYCHPEVINDAYDELINAARNASNHPRIVEFKQQFQIALLDPGEIPHPEALYQAGQFDDGTDQRFLRRLWRDLYPDEPVPGGDDEFREHLRQLIDGEVDQVPRTVDPYDEMFYRKKTPHELRQLGRTVWKRFYPDEPL